MKTTLTTTLTGQFGFYAPDPGNGLSPLQVEQHEETQLHIFAPYKLNGMHLTMDQNEFMSIDEMEKDTLAVLASNDEYTQPKLEGRIRAMTHMQRFLLSRLQDEQNAAKSACEPPVVVVDMDGGAIHCVRSSKPVRVILLDDDVECSDGEQIIDVLGDEKYVHDFNLTDTSMPHCPNGISPIYVEAVTQEIRDASTVK